MFKVEKTWQTLTDSNASLRGLDAHERVENLIKATKLKNLFSPAPIEQGYSTKFWTLCKGFQKPLDPIDGLLVSGRPPEPCLLYTSDAADE